MIIKIWQYKSSIMQKYNIYYTQNDSLALLNNSARTKMEQTTLTKNPFSSQTCINNHPDEVFNRCFESHSREGECRVCEFKSHPERFAGCLFCDKPFNIKLDGCSECLSGFESWVSKHVSLNGKSLYCPGRVTDRIESMKTFHGIPVPYVPRKGDFPSFKAGEWPGFTTLSAEGKVEWIVPDISVNIEEVCTWDNCEEVALRALEKNGIFVYDEIQYRP